MKIAVPLSQSETPEGLAVFAFSHDGTAVYDPFLSSCGRFEADPVKDYHLDAASAQALKQLNAMVVAGTDAAVSAVCERLSELGVPEDEAFFADEDHRRVLSKGVADYLQSRFPALGLTLADD